jgi:hypothetical protein
VPGEGMDSNYGKFGPMERTNKQSDEHPVFVNRKKVFNRSRNALYNGVNE